MFFSRKLIVNHLWDSRKHHQLYNQSRDIFERAANKVEVFFATVGKQPAVSDKAQVDTLVKSLQRVQAGIHRRAKLASDPAIRTKIRTKDYDYIQQREERVVVWLERVIKVQQMLQTQKDAETWFKKEEKRRVQQRRAKITLTYLLEKPLPPLRRTTYKGGVRHRVTIVAEDDNEAYQIPVFLEDDILDPIIDSYYVRKTYRGDFIPDVPDIPKALTQEEVVEWI